MRAQQGQSKGTARAQQGQHSKGTARALQGHSKGTARALRILRVPSAAFDTAPSLSHQIVISGLLVLEPILVSANRVTLRAFSPRSSP